MITSRYKHNLWKKAMAIGAVCLFLANHLAWAYPDSLATSAGSDEVYEQMLEQMEQNWLKRCEENVRSALGELETTQAQVRKLAQILAVATEEGKALVLEIKDGEGVLTQSQRINLKGNLEEAEEVEITVVDSKVVSIRPLSPGISHYVMIDRPYKRKYQEHKRDRSLRKVRPLAAEWPGVIEDALTALRKIAEFDCSIAVTLAERLDTLSKVNESEATVTKDGLKIIESGINLVEEDEDVTLPHAGGFGINIPYRQGMSRREIFRRLFHEIISANMFGDKTRVHQLANAVVDVVESQDYEGAARLLSRHEITNSGVAQSMFDCIAQVALHLAREVHDRGFNAIIMSGESAELPHQLFIATWERLYGEEPIPKIYMLNEEANIELYKDRPLGDLGDTHKTEEIICRHLGTGEGRALINTIQTGKVVYVDDLTEMGLKPAYLGIIFDKFGGDTPVSFAYLTAEPQCKIEPFAISGIIGSWDVRVYARIEKIIEDYKEGTRRRKALDRAKAAMDKIKLGIASVPVLSDQAVWEMEAEKRAEIAGVRDLADESEISPDSQPEKPTSSQPAKQTQEPAKPVARGDGDGGIADILSTIDPKTGGTAVYAYMLKDLLREAGYPVPYNARVGYLDQPVDPRKVLHRNCPNVGIFVRGIQGLTLAGFAAAMADVKDVNLLYLLPTKNLFAGRDHPDMVFAEYAAFVDVDGNIVCCQFTDPVPIHGMVHAGMPIPRGKSRNFFEDRGIPLLNSTEIIKICDDKVELKRFLEENGLGAHVAEYAPISQDAPKEDVEGTIRQFVEESKAAKLVVKPADSGCGHHVRMVDGDGPGIGQAISHVLSIKNRHKTIVERRIEGRKWQEDGKRLDWNLRVIATWNEKGEVVITPEMVEARYGEYNGPINVSRGADAITLEEFYKRTGFTEEEVFKPAKELVEKAMERLKDRFGVQPGLIGWDLMQDDNENMWILEANAAALGGILTLEKMHPDSKRGATIGPVVNYLRCVARDYWKKHQAVETDTVGERMPAVLNADQLLDISSALAETRYYNLAEKVCRQALLLDEDMPEVWTNLGVTLRNQGKLVEAEMAQRTALTLDNRFVLAWVNLGSVLIQQGRHKQAENAFREALAVNENDLAARVNLAHSLMQQGRFSEAEDVCRQALEIDDSFEDAEVNLVAALLHQKRYAEVEVECQKTLGANDRSAGIWANLGAARLYQARDIKEMQDKMKKYAEAEESLRRAAELAEELEVPDRERLMVLVNLANALICQSKYFPAVEASVEALRLNERDVWAWKILAKALEKMGKDELVKRAKARDRTLLAELAQPKPSVGGTVPLIVRDELDLFEIKKAPKKEPGEKEAGAGPTQAGLLPHRGYREEGTVNDQMILTLKSCVPDLIAEGRISEDDARPFLEWVKGWEEARGNGEAEDDVPIDYHLPIEKLVAPEMEFLSFSGKMLRVVMLPVDKLGEVDSEPFYGHVGYREGILWIAAKADPLVVELRIMHEIHEYNLAAATAKRLFLDTGYAENWDEAMLKMARLRDNPTSVVDILPFGIFWLPYEVRMLFEIMHVNAWRIVRDRCRQGWQKGLMPKEKYDLAEAYHTQAAESTQYQNFIETGILETKFAQFGIGVVMAETAGEPEVFQTDASPTESRKVRAEGRIDVDDKVYNIGWKYTGKEVIVKPFDGKSRKSGIRVEWGGKEIYWYNAATGEYERIGQPERKTIIAERKAYILAEIAAHAVSGEKLSWRILSEKTGIPRRSLQRLMEDRVVKTAYEAREDTPELSIWIAYFSEIVEQDEFLDAARDIARALAGENGGDKPNISSVARALPQYAQRTRKANALMHDLRRYVKNHIRIRDKRNNQMNRRLAYKALVLCLEIEKERGGPSRPAPLNHEEEELLQAVAAVAARLQQAQEAQPTITQVANEDGVRALLGDVAKPGGVLANRLMKIARKQVMEEGDESDETVRQRHAELLEEVGIRRAATSKRSRLSDDELLTKIHDIVSEKTQDGEEPPNMTEVVEEIPGLGLGSLFARLKTIATKRVKRSGNPVTKEAVEQSYASLLNELSIRRKGRVRAKPVEAEPLPHPAAKEKAEPIIAEQIESTQQGQEITDPVLLQAQTHIEEGNQYLRRYQWELAKRAFGFAMSLADSGAEVEGLEEAAAAIASEAGQRIAECDDFLDEEMRAIVVDADGALIRLCGLLDQKMRALEADHQAVADVPHRDGYYDRMRAELRGYCEIVLQKMHSHPLFDEVVSESAVGQIRADMADHVEKFIVRLGGKPAKPAEIEASTPGPPAILRQHYHALDAHSKSHVDAVMNEHYPAGPDVIIRNILSAVLAPLEKGGIARPEALQTLAAYFAERLPALGPAASEGLASAFLEDLERHAGPLRVTNDFEDEADPGTAVSQAGLLPHRGMGYVNDCIVRALGNNLKAIAKRVGVSSKDYAKYYGEFESWFLDRVDKGLRVDEVPPDIQLHIDMLTRLEDYIDVVAPDGSLIKRLKIVQIPVKELGWVDGKPFYGHISYREGIIWVAADIDEAEVEVNIMHEEEEYNIAAEEAQRRGWSMARMALWRDGKYEDPNPEYGGFEKAKKFIQKAHIDAWDRVASICLEEGRVDKFSKAQQHFRDAQIALVRQRRTDEVPQEFGAAAASSDESKSPEEPSELPPGPYEHPLGPNPQMELDKGLGSTLDRTIKWFLNNGYEDAKWLQLYRAAATHAEFDPKRGYDFGKAPTHINPWTGLPQVLIGSSVLHKHFSDRLLSAHDFVMYATRIPREAKGLAVAAVSQADMIQLSNNADQVIGEQILHLFEHYINLVINQVPEVEGDRGKAIVHLVRNLNKEEYRLLGQFFSNSGNAIITLETNIMSMEYLEGTEHAKALNWAETNHLFDPDQIQISLRKEQQLLLSGGQDDKILTVELQHMGSSDFREWLAGNLDLLRSNRDVRVSVFFMLQQMFVHLTSVGQKGFNPIHAQTIRDGQLPDVGEFLAPTSAILEPVRQRAKVWEERIAKMEIPQQHKETGVALIPSHQALLEQINDLGPNKISALELNMLLGSVLPQVPLISLQANDFNTIRVHITLLASKHPFLSSQERQLLAQLQLSDQQFQPLVAQKLKEISGGAIMKGEESFEEFGRMLAEQAEEETEHFERLSSEEQRKLEEDLEEISSKTQGASTPLYDAIREKYDTVQHKMREGYLVVKMPFLFAEGKPNDYIVDIDSAHQKVTPEMLAQIRKAFGTDKVLFVSDVILGIENDSMRQEAVAHAFSCVAVGHQEAIDEQQKVWTENRRDTDDRKGNLARYLRTKIRIAEISKQLLGEIDRLKDLDYFTDEELEELETTLRAIPNIPFLLTSEPGMQVVYEEDEPCSIETAKLEVNPDDLSPRADLEMRGILLHGATHMLRKWRRYEEASWRLYGELPRQMQEIFESETHIEKMIRLNLLVIEGELAAYESESRYVLSQMPSDQTKWADVLTPPQTLPIELVSMMRAISQGNQREFINLVLHTGSLRKYMENLWTYFRRCLAGGLADEEAEGTFYEWLIPIVQRHRWTMQCVDSVRARVERLEKGQKLALVIDTSIGNLKEYDKHDFITKLEGMAERLGLPPEQFEIITGEGTVLVGRVNAFLQKNKNGIVRGVVSSRSQRHYVNRFDKNEEIKQRVKLVAVEDEKVANTDENKLHYNPIMPAIRYSLTGEFEPSPYAEEPETVQDSVIGVILRFKPAEPVNKNGLIQRFREDALFLESA